jgi:predicted site-specific integrase-resolvase
MIGVSRPVLHKWSKAGIMRSHKLGGKLFYFESEVMEDMKKS